MAQQDPQQQQQAALSVGELPRWILKDFSEGLIDKIVDYVLPNNASPDCLNVIATKIGSLVNRPGQALLGSGLGAAVQGLYAYYYGTNRRLVVAANGAVYYHAGGGTFTSIKTGISTTAPVDFATTVNYMVACNGVNAPWKWDGSTVSNLANAPATAQFFTLHKEKLFCVPKNKPSQLRWSDSFAPESWPSVNVGNVKTGDGDVITCLRVHLGELVIFKKYSTHVLKGTSLDTFKQEEMDTEIGCVSHRAAVASGAYLYFVSFGGICVWNGLSVVNLSRDRIPGFWSRVNQQYLYKAAAAVRNGRIWFALPVDGSTYNNYVLVYEPPASGTGNGKFWLWNGINASCFAEYDDGTQLLLYSGNSNAGEVDQQDVGTSDFGSAITSYWVCKPTDLTIPEYKKKFLLGYIVDSPGANDVSLSVALDYGPYTALTADVGSSALVRKFRFPGGSYGYYMSAKLIYTGTAGFEVRCIVIPCYPKVRAG